MKKLIAVFVTLLLCSLAAGSPVSVFADEETSNPYGTVRLSRVSLIEGELLLQRGDDDVWVAASVNMPLRPHDKLWATDGARAEIQFDDGTVVRLAENTSLDLLSLDPDWIHLELTLGVATVVAHAPRGGAREPFLELDTPQATVQVTRSTTFRTDVAEDGSTEMTVREGAVELARDEEPVRIAQHQRVVIEGGDAPRYLLESAEAPDDWDRWNDERETQLAQSRSREHIVADVAPMGMSELDSYGRWDQVPSYGWAWVPRVTVGWVPYQIGRWVWVEPWGWTWVSYEPWGWLPYHYGRWVVAGGVGWVWVPGSTLGFWAPGCVRFIYGPEWVAWVPLGPGEIYYYHPGVSVHVGVNLINYRVPGAVMVMPRQRFVTGVAGRGTFIPPKDPIRSGRIAAGPPPVVPTHASLHPRPETIVRSNWLPPRVIHRPVVYTRPPSPRPPLFEHRVKELHEVITQGRPPAGVAPHHQERDVPTVEERRVPSEKIHKEITVHRSMASFPSVTTRERTPRLPEEPSTTSRAEKSVQPHRPKHVELSETPPTPSASTPPATKPSASAPSKEQPREVRPLYRVPPTPKVKQETPKVKPEETAPNKSGRSERTPDKP